MSRISATAGIGALAACMLLPFPLLPNDSTNTHMTLVAPVIDAVLDDIWQRAETVVVDDRCADEGKEQYFALDARDASATFRTLWDTEHFYLFLDVTDNFLAGESHEGCAYWQSDGAEIYFDMSNGKSTEVVDNQDARDYGYFQVRLAWNPVRPGVDARGVMEHRGRNLPSDNVVTDWEYLTSDSGNGYTIEAALDWSEMMSAMTTPPDLGEGSRVGFEVTVADNDGIADICREGRIVWNDTNHMVYKVPAEAGTMTLLGARDTGIVAVSHEITAVASASQAPVEILPVGNGVYRFASTVSGRCMVSVHAADGSRIGCFGIDSKGTHVWHTPASGVYLLRIPGNGAAVTRRVAVRK